MGFVGQQERDGSKGHVSGSVAEVRTAQGTNSDI